jgi:drug/metabolite transporter (DMT)-like permease
VERTIKNYFSVAILAVIWGSSFILMKRGLEVFNYMQVANARIFIAFITLIPLMPKAFKLVKRRHFFPILITALLGNGIPAILFAKAQTYLDSSLVGILNSTVPLFTIIIGFLFFKIKPNKANVIGVLVGLLGVLFLTIL